MLEIACKKCELHLSIIKMSLIIEAGDIKCVCDTECDVWKINDKRYKCDKIANVVRVGKYLLNGIFSNGGFITYKSKDYPITRSDFIPQTFVSNCPVNKGSRISLAKYIEDNDLDYKEFYELNESDLVDAGIPYDVRKYLMDIFEKI